MQLTLEELQPAVSDPHISQSSYRGSERRLEPRHIVASRAIVQALDATLEPVGEPYEVVVRDISKQGIGLLHTQPVTSDFLSVCMAGEPASRYLVRPLRCHQCGVYYDIGARFMTDRELLQIALRGWQNAIDRLTDLAHRIDDRPALLRDHASD